MSQISAIRDTEIPKRDYCVFFIAEKEETKCQF